MANTPTTGNDTIYGDSIAGDYIDALAGNDAVYGQGGNDTLLGGDGGDTIYGGSGNDYINLGAYTERLEYAYGGEGNDTLTAESSTYSFPRLLNGEAGNDTFLLGQVKGMFAYGGVGDDTYFKDASVQSWITEYQGEGFDTVIISGITTNYILEDDVEALINQGGAMTLTGNASDNWIYSAASAKDTLIGGVGNDTLIGNGDGDSLVGGVGNDTYRFGTGDVVVENANEGTDTIESSISISSLQANIENITLIDTWSAGSGSTITNAGIGAVGSEFDNRIQGSSSGNLLNGLAGNDTLLGWAGNDTLLGGDGSDVLDGGEGADILAGGLYKSFALFNGVGNYYWAQGNDTYRFAQGGGQDTIWDFDNTVGNTDVLEIGAGVSGADLTVTRSGDDLKMAIRGTADTLTIGSFFDSSNGYVIEQTKLADGSIWDASTLVGLSSAVTTTSNAVTVALNGSANANDLLRSGSGDDTLSGFAGNDFLFAGAGSDYLQGGEGADWLYGEAGNDDLDGGTGADTMVGGAGDDVYHVDSWSDQVIESADGGDDSVLSTVTYTMGDNIENAMLLGNKAIDLYGRAFKGSGLLGNAGANTITGGAGSDTISGMGGADTLIGGAGTDFYYLMGNETVIEQAADTGLDVVMSAQSSVTLADNIEAVFLYANTAKSAVGNASANSMYANDNGAYFDGRGGNDILLGGAGADTLTGGTGNDDLQGQAGNDLYTHRAGDGFDTILDVDSSLGNSDRLDWQGVNTDQLWFSQSGSDLRIQVLGTQEGTLIKGWFGGSANQVEQITLGSKTLTNDRVGALVQVMSSMTAPTTSLANLGTADQARVQTALAAAWLG